MSIDVSLIKGSAHFIARLVQTAINRFSRPLRISLRLRGSYACLFFNLFRGLARLFPRLFRLGAGVLILAWGTGCHRDRAKD